ncbi:MAG: hypothetical protein ACJASQ_002534 [Crocinitomicaceae bacterium]|jgi:hypothetical protein
MWEQQLEENRNVNLNALVIILGIVIFGMIGEVLASSTMNETKY